MRDFQEYISSLSLHQIREHLNILNSLYVNKLSNTSLSCSPGSGDVGGYSAEDFVKYEDDFLGKMILMFLWLSVCL